MQDTPVIEAMLLRWSESHNGRTVTLQLPAEGDHPFRGLPCGPANGQRLAIAVALINDDETTRPVEPEGDGYQREPGKSPPGKRGSAPRASEKPAGGQNGEGHEMPKGGRLARQAGILCGDVRFWKYLEEVRGVRVISAADCADYVRAWCGVESRAELDADAIAAATWNRLYAQYLAQTA
jgi:hypothetical protein